MFLATVVGPTGSGKSALALCLAQQFGGEIVNCDSLQLYRGLDIGTAKTPPGERRGVPHHMFDVLTPQESYSAGEYAREARKVIAEITGRGRLPIVVGGTGFYLRALLEGLPVLPGRDERLRERLLDRERLRPGSLHRLLTRLEPHAAGRIHANDVQKTMRALEVRLLTQQALPPPTEAQALEGYTAIKLGLDPDRAALQQRLEGRTRGMFEGGLIEEVRGLLAAGGTGEEKPFEALGYKQALLHLRGTITLEQAVESTIVETRQYAKRQRTWFRRDLQIRWLVGFGDDPEILAQATQAEINALRGAEAGVEHFLDATQLGRPGAPHLVKTGIDVGAQIINARINIQAKIIDTGIYISDTGIYVPQPRVVDQDSD